MFFTLITPAFAEGTTSNKRVLHESSENAVSKLSNRLISQFDEDEKVTFLVKFKEKADTDKVVKEAKRNASINNLSEQKTEFVQRSSVVSALKETAMVEQKKAMKLLENEMIKGKVDSVHSYFIVNALAVTATKEIAEKMAILPEVEKVLPNEKRQLTLPVSDSETAPSSDQENVEWNVEKLNVPEVWEMGLDGAGTVVASIDTGVQWDHPALKEKYRGYDADTGTVNHDFNWFDATAGLTEPYDDQGHGTHVTGTMVGSEPDGTNRIGVAPGAKWIGIKAFGADGTATDESLLAAAEWIMAPTDSEGNVRVDLAPDIVNNSWGGGPGLDEWYREVVTQWRNANIFPVFAAGNVDNDNRGGPGSVATPANYPESFAVGALDIGDDVASFSLRGPSPYDEIKPEVTAPGQVIRSAVPGDGYYENSGTSMAAPAVSGVIALVKQANSNLDVDEIETILLNTAVPLTDEEYPETPNNGYGYGKVDAQNAVLAIDEGVATIEGTVTELVDGTANPLSAQVSFLGKNRSVNTNPDDGSFSMNYAAGEHTLLIESYGYYSVEESINLVADEVSEVNVTLEKIPETTIAGTIIDQTTGEPIEGANLLLVEDANIAPVQTNENGLYEITAYEGDYTLRVSASGYVPKEVDVSFTQENNEYTVELEPFYSYPGGELAYDDGDGEGGSWFLEAGNAWGVRMSLDEGQEKALVTEGKFLFAPRGGDDFQVVVMDSSGSNDAPGEIIAGPYDATAVKNGEWTTVDLSNYGIIVEDDFYMVYIQSEGRETAPRLQNDKDEFTYRSWEMYKGYWYPLEPNFLTGNKMIRAVVEYEVDEPVITSPQNNEFFTENSTVTVEGTASPTTTIHLENNGEDVGTANIRDDGSFSVEVELSEGLNELQAISKQGGKVTGKSDVVKVSVVPEEPVQRLSGEIRYDTAIAISQAGWSQADTVVLSRGLEFADALAGVPLAEKLNAPILLTRSDELYADTLAEIERLGASKVVVLGGTGAISDDVTAELEASGLDIERLAGETRYETAALIAEKVAPNGSEQVVVASGRDFPDAMSVAAHAANEGMPILLTRPNELPAATSTAIENLGTTDTLIVGGYDVVTDEVASALPGVDRVRGEDRYATNLAINDYFGLESRHVFVATGKEFADALTGAVLAAKHNSSILLVDDQVSDGLSDFITENGSLQMTIFGGTVAIDEEVYDQLQQLLQ
ncbi:S8 family serine peptidase [Ornithinibacillus halophilus]